MKTIKNHLLLSQILLAVLLLICSLIRPSVLAHNGGVSNFGNYLNTAIPYTLAFVCNIFILLFVTIRLMGSVVKLRLAGYSLIGLILIEFLVLISTFPRHFAWIYSEIHDALAVFLFSYELLLSLSWVVAIKSRLAIISFLIQLAGCLIALITIVGLVHLLYIGQLIGLAGFGLMVVCILPQLITRLQTKD